jgi:hypothetical protein
VNVEKEKVIKEEKLNLIKYSKEVYVDNLYRNPDTNEIINVPKNKDVVILGYNSGRFDANLIYKNLHNPPRRLDLHHCVLYY